MISILKISNRTQGLAKVILQKDTISILTIYKITKWHKTEKNCRKSNSSQSKSGHTLFVPSFVK